MSLHIALVHHDPAPAVHELAAALEAAGHRAVVVRAGHGRGRARAGEIRVPRLPERPLHRRGFEGPLTHVPAAALALHRGGFDVVHAFSPADAAAALLWRRLGGAPVVFSPAEALDRERASNRRLRLELVARALERSDAVAVLDPVSAADLRRWFAVDAPVIVPADAPGHLALYESVL